MSTLCLRAFETDRKTMKKFQLKLYITGRTLASLRAIDIYQHICEERIPGQYDLTIIDVLEDPTVIEREDIALTPLLIRELPLPRVRAVGLITEVERFINLFDLYPD